MHGDCPCVKPDQPGTTQLKKITLSSCSTTLSFTTTISLPLNLSFLHSWLFILFYFVELFYQVWNWRILRVDGMRNLTICSIIGPSSSSSVTKWLVAPISFTPASYACNIQIIKPSNSVSGYQMQSPWVRIHQSYFENTTSTNQHIRFSSIKIIHCLADWRQICFETYDQVQKILFRLSEGTCLYGFAPLNEGKSPWWMLIISFSYPLRNCADNTCTMVTIGDEQLQSLPPHMLWGMWALCDHSS